MWSKSSVGETMLKAPGIFAEPRHLLRRFARQ
jgi:hypothetical protein